MNEHKNTYYGLPSEVKFCKECVISNQRPSSTVEFKSTANDKKESIAFDDNNICSACRYHEDKEHLINWKEREERLKEILSKFRSKDGSYDVVVPGSGGKDSAYTSHVLKYKYGMNPLTVTWAPHAYTNIGWENFQNWICIGGHDNFLYTPNGTLHRELTRNAFLNLLHPFQPFIVGQRIIGPAIAKRFGIKLVMYGENQAESGNNIEDNNNPLMNIDFFSNENTLDIKLGGLAIKDYIDTGRYTIGDFAPYVPPNKKDLIDAGIEVHYLGYYLKWKPHDCYEYAVAHTGFKENPERTEGSYTTYSGLDDKIDPFHYFTTLIKFGIGRATYDAAQEVRNGDISREEAIQLVSQYDTEFPSKYFQDFLEYINITEDEFWETIDKFRSPHLWVRDNNIWKLRHKVSGDGYND